jgi:hypothetical protein
MPGGSELHVTGDVSPRSRGGAAVDGWVGEDKT